MRVHGHYESRPDGEGPSALGEPMEAGIECLYNRLPRTYNIFNEVTEKSTNSLDRLHRLCYRPTFKLSVPS